MKTFFKENFVLIAGISLPLILTVIFLIAVNSKAPLQDPPKTPVVYAINNYYETVYSFHVNNKGELEFNYSPPDDSGNCCSLPKLYVYDPVTKTEENLQIPDHDKNKKATYIIPYPKKLSSQTTSPDGWLFEYDYNYNDSNLITELFGGSSRGYRNVLIKDNHKIEVSSRRYENGKFLAWVMPEEKQ